MSEKKHSPLPWSFKSSVVWSGVNCVAETDGFTVVEMHANAAFIVTACNSFDAMREALEELVVLGNGGSKAVEKSLIKARAALALASD